MHLQFFRVIPALRRPSPSSFALRLAAATLFAIAAAHVLPFADPWWSALTVWMLARPTRGQALGRTIAQFSGTIAGGIAATALASITRGSPDLLVPALLAWVAFCCGLGNFLRSEHAYGATLCGLVTTAVAVSTDGVTAHAAAFALARLLDTGIGAAAALLVITLWNPPASTATLFEIAHTLLRESLTHTAAIMLNPSAAPPARTRALLVALAELHAKAEAGVAGPLAQRRRLKPLRAQLGALLDLLELAPALRRHAAALPDTRHEDLLQLEASLYDLAETLDAGRGMPLAIVRTATRQLRGADRLFDVCLENLEQTLAALAASHRALTAPQSGAFSSNSGGPRQLLRPDAASVRLATSRALGVGALSTAVWLACGGNAARHVLLGAGIFIVLAAAIDDSEPRTAWLLAGCFAGAAAALIWHTGFGPGAHVVWAWAALLAPLTVAAAALADRRTDGVGLAFTLTFAILMLPSHPALHAEPMHAVNAVAMLLTGIVSTHVAYRWLVPLAARRRQLLLRALRAEVAAIAAHADAPQRAMRHLARLRVHVLRLLSVVEDSGASDGALAMLSLGHALLRMGALLQQRPDAAQAQCIRHALSIASRTHAAPHANAKALQGYAEELQASGDALPVARGLQDAASCLASCGSLFVNSSARCGGTPAFVLPRAEGSSAPHKRA